MNNTKINIGPGTDIDLDDLIESRMLIQANSGGGKTGIAKVMMEESVGKIPFIVLDKKGEYYPIKEIFNDVIIIGGRNADIAISMQAAPVLAKYIIKHGLTVIIDMSQLESDDKRAEYIAAFLKGLMNLDEDYWTQYLIFIEEAHVFCGQQEKTPSAKYVKLLMSEGRKMGYCGILITQRISKLHKDAAAECNNKFIGRTFLDLDMNRSGSEMGLAGQEKLKLRELKKQHFWAFGTSIQPHHVHEVTVKNAKAAFVKSGSKYLLTVKKPTEKIKQALAKLNDLPKEAAAEFKTINDLQAEVKRLTTELKKSTKPADKKTTDAHALQVQTITEQLTKTKAYVFQLQNELLEQERLKTTYAKLAVTRKVLLDKIFKSLLANKEKSDLFLTALSAEIEKIEEVQVPQIGKSAGKNNYSVPVKLKQVVIETSHPVTSVEKTPIKYESGNSSTVSGGEKLTLIACASYENGLRRDQLVVFTGYKKTSRDIFIGRLKKDGYLEQVGDRLKATQLGIDILGTDYTPLPKGEALQEYWLKELGGGENEVLQALINAYPESLRRDNLGTATDYKKTSRDIFIGRLVARELIKISGKGEVKASEYLFD